MQQYNLLASSEISTILHYYTLYQNNSETLDQSWYYFFQGFEYATQKSHILEQDTSKLSKEFKVVNLIYQYRLRGHLFTKTNPVRKPEKHSPELTLKHFGLEEHDLKLKFKAGEILNLSYPTLQEIIDHLEETYCKHIGVEYIFIRKPEILEWFQTKIEPTKNTTQFSENDKKHFYTHLLHAVGFEKFIHKRFVGQKRFSLEGAEALIPALDMVIEHGADLGIREFIIGMSHRGRLNVLANILEKPYEQLFEEFHGEEYEDNIALGDVKYHLGYGNDITTDNGKMVRVNLAPNPSHLEAVDAIVQGISKAKIYYKYQDDSTKLAPILIHGDAAISAQGVVYEVIQMAGLNAYKTGGTIHLVINNQIGFTTNYSDGRTSTYCTDIAKVTKSPILHVNGDDVEALVHAVKLAMEYRQTFHTDVFIDLLCYRKYGHNESDEPRYTQPELYQKINNHPNIRDIYAKKLLKETVFTKKEIDKLNNDFNLFLEKKFTLSKTIEKVRIPLFLEEDWIDFKKETDYNNTETAITAFDKNSLIEIAKKINYLPLEKKFFKKIGKLLESRRKMIADNKLDWAMAELLAYGTLIAEGYPVRISGQDSERGTFSHRHAVFNIEDTDNKYIPLKHISENKNMFHIFNSHLSEYGVLGFEYGYALAMPNGLTIWEAQFGDFSNVAQVVFDQYISSAEDKWGIMNGITLYLPHGYEGQGPEHSSARLERLLTLSANYNMQIVNCTTPANLFHVLRRQIHRKYRKPLIILTPKSLLRHPLCSSTIDELANSNFEPILDDNITNTKDIKKVILCSGKIYYELLNRKTELQAKEYAIIRIEQLYPFNYKYFFELKKKYQQAIEWQWVQEEPENMGAAMYIKNLELKTKLSIISRPASGSPATGLHKIHQISQQAIINKSFKSCNCELKEQYCNFRCIKRAKENASIN